MTYTIIATRKYDGYEFTFELVNSEYKEVEYQYIICNVPPRKWHGACTIYLDTRNIADSDGYHRGQRENYLRLDEYVQPWILRKVKNVMERLEKKHCTVNSNQMLEILMDKARNLR